jgi:hypothetical protein
MKTLREKLLSVPTQKLEARLAKQVGSRDVRAGDDHSDSE